MATEGSRRAIIAALLANMGIAVAKFVGFLITGAASLLAEALHSAADSGNQALLLLGARMARRRATPDHPFGYGRERYFWAFVVSLVLFSLGGLFAIFEGIEKLRPPPRTRVGRDRHRHPGGGHRARDLLAAHRHPGGQPRPWGRVVVELHPPLEVPRAPGGPAGGHGGRGRSRAGAQRGGPGHRDGRTEWDAAGSLGIGVLLV